MNFIIRDITKTSTTTSSSISYSGGNSGGGSSVDLSNYLTLGGGTLSGQLYTTSDIEAEFDNNKGSIFTLGGIAAKKSIQANDFYASNGITANGDLYIGGSITAFNGLTVNGTSSMNGVLNMNNNNINNVGVLNSSSVSIVNRINFNNGNAWLNWNGLGIHSNVNIYTDGYFYGDGGGLTGTAYNLIVGSTKLLSGINTTSINTSNWNPQQLTYQAWGQAFTHSDITSDSGDIGYWLRPSQYSNGQTELCVVIDGDFYAGNGQYKVIHSGSIANQSVYHSTTADNAAFATSAGYAMNANTVNNVTSSQIISGLGYTPYNATTNSNGYITNSLLSNYLPLSGGTLTGGLTVNSTTEAEFDNNKGSILTYGGITAKKSIQANDLYLNQGIAANGDIYIGGSFNGSGSGLSGTANSLNVNYANYSGSLNSSNYISQRGATGTWNGDFQATPAGTLTYGGDVGASGTNNAGGSWWFQQNFRHTNSSNYWGVQVAWGWEDNKNRLATRNISGGSYSDWVYYLNSYNFSQWAAATNHVHDAYATHRPEGAQYIDYARCVYNNGAYSGSGWVEPSDLGVRYANSANYANSAGRAYPYRSDGTAINLNWSGQSGQPTWLWGGSDGVNMYVYNPSNFSVNYANSAGSANSANSASNANTVGGYTASQLMSSISGGATNFNAKRNSSNYTLTNSDVWYTATGSQDIYLPSSPTLGKFYFIKCQGTSGVYINGNGNSINAANNVFTRTDINSSGYIYMLIWDGAYWQLARFM